MRTHDIVYFLGSYIGLLKVVEKRSIPIIPLVENTAKSFVISNACINKNRVVGRSNDVTMKAQNNSLQVKVKKIIPHYSSYTHNIL